MLPVRLRPPLQDAAVPAVHQQASCLMNTEDTARFFSKVQQGHPDQCWLWIAARDKDGYGRFFLNGQTRRAHRVSYEIVHGPIPDELETLHSCDNPPCVNPNHISVGTSLDNSQDCIQKGRHIWTTNPERCPRGHAHYLYGQVVCSLPGETNPAAKLTEVQVIAIRAAHAEGQFNYRQIATCYGVTAECIGHIVRRRAWKHI